MIIFFFFFFFQAEDGIRDGRVTGVQTCALPISRAPADQVTGINAFLLEDGINIIHLIAQTKRRRWRDRKSTRLNSSHPSISYAVFCLKKKKKKKKSKQKLTTSYTINDADSVLLI